MAFGVQNPFTRVQLFADIIVMVICDGNMDRVCLGSDQFLFTIIALWLRNYKNILPGIDTKN